MTPDQHAKLMTAWRKDLADSDYGALKAPGILPIYDERPSLLRYTDRNHQAAVRRIMMRMYDVGMPCSDIADVWGTRPNVVFDYVQMARKTVVLKVICSNGDGRNKRYSVGSKPERPCIG